MAKKPCYSEGKGAADCDSVAPLLTRLPERGAESSGADATDHGDPPQRPSTAGAVPSVPALRHESRAPFAGSPRLLPALPGGLESALAAEAARRAHEAKP